MPYNINAVFIDDDLKLLAQLQTEQIQANLTTFNNYEDFLKYPSFKNLKVAFCDIYLESTTCHNYILEIKKKYPETLIVIVTGNPIAKDLISLMNLKVDGIIEKPFTVSQLNQYILSNALKNDELQKIELFPEKRQVRFGGTSYKLTKTEYFILEKLVNNQNKVISRDELTKILWPGILVSKNTLDTHLYNLKAKVPALETKIQCLHGEGFYIESL